MKAVQEEQVAPTAELGEALSGLRLRSSAALEPVRASMARQGQLLPLAVVAASGSGPVRYEVIDGFKRLYAARALDLPTLRVLPLGLAMPSAKAAILSFNASQHLSEIEEAWLVRSLYREDRLAQAEIGQLLGRDKSWVCRRLALVESLDEALQADLHLGLLTASAGRELARLPRSNQRPTADVVLGRGLTVHQTARLVDQLLSGSSLAGCLATLAESGARRARSPRRSPSRCERLLADMRAIQRIAGRLQAVLLEAPLSALGADASQLVRGQLGPLRSVLASLARSAERVLEESPCSGG